MKTPITDAVTGISPLHKVENLQQVSRRLERDRAALMESLIQIANQKANRYESTVGIVCNIAESALSAARANFPNED